MFSILQMLFGAKEQGTECHEKEVKGIKASILFDWNSDNYRL
jgi:hypothetical protein